MKLGVREAARMLNVSETKIYRWVDQEEIPFAMIQHHPMFHRVELLEWAIEMELPVSADLYEDDGDHPLTSAFQRGGGYVINESLESIAMNLATVSPADREVIGAVIAARANEMFVARAADGIFVPKARSPIVCPDASPLLMLCWSGPRPIILGGAPANVVFVIVAPTVKDHLKLLSRLSLALHGAAFRAAVQGRDAFDPVLAESRRFEQALDAARRSPGA